MAWQGVLKGFREQAESFQFKTSDSLDVSGRVLGEGPPLYILNGLSATSELFCLTTWLLREHFRCVIIDYPEKATSLSQLTSSLFTVADGFGDDQFDLYATSFSTAVALEALSTDAGRIRRAVLQGAVNGVRLSFLERLAPAQPRAEAFEERVTGDEFGSAGIDHFPVRFARGGWPAGVVDHGLG